MVGYPVEKRIGSQFPVRIRAPVGPISFSWTAALGYLLLGLMFVEVCFDPLWIDFPYQAQLVAIAAVLAIADVFTIGIVLARAPLSITAYVRPGDKDGEVVEGITWSSHFTDLRVAVSDPTNDDYNNVDILLNPGYWVREARIYDDQKACTLLRVEGTDLKVAMRATSDPDRNNTITFHQFGLEDDVTDSEGNVWTVLATGAGYRLRCNTLPSRSTVKIIFAVAATFSPSLDVPAPGSGTFAADVAGAKSPMDVFGSAPGITSVSVGGAYTRCLLKPP